MKLETFKSILLVLLIGLSLLLTFGLWNYQSEFEELDDKENVSDTSVGGNKMEAESNVILPSSIIFHAGQQHLGYKDPQKQQQLFEDMQTWVYTNFSIKDANWDADDFDIEIRFPDALPIQVVTSLFQFTNTDKVDANWSFDHIYLRLKEDTSTITVLFPSVDGRRQATASVSNSANYNQFKQLFASREDLTEFLLFNEGERDIFIPSKTKDLKKRSLIVNKIPSDRFVRALFPNTTRVNRSDEGERGIGEFYFADSEREMRIQYHETKLEYYYPYATDNDAGQNDPVELIDRSISTIDSHDGWFANYQLYDLDTSSNRVIYRMSYNGYPVYNEYGLSLMEVQYQGLDIYRYNRSLLKLSNEVRTEDIDVPSGADVIRYVNNELTDEVDQIQDIQLMYDFQYQTDNSVILNPVWFMQINGTWKKLFPDLETPTSQQGGV